jgi:hypothetical protein
MMCGLTASTSSGVAKDDHWSSWSFLDSKIDILMNTIQYTTTFFQNLYKITEPSAAEVVNRQEITDISQNSLWCFRRFSFESYLSNNPLTSLLLSLSLSLSLVSPSIRSLYYSFPLHHQDHLEKLQSSSFSSALFSDLLSSIEQNEMAQKRYYLIFPPTALPSSSTSSSSSSSLSHTFPLLLTEKEYHIEFLVLISSSLTFGSYAIERKLYQAKRIDTPFSFFLFRDSDQESDIHSHPDSDRDSHRESDRNSHREGDRDSHRESDRDSGLDNQTHSEDAIALGGLESFNSFSVLSCEETFDHSIQYIFGNSGDWALQRKAFLNSNGSLSRSVLSPIDFHQQFEPLRDYYLLPLEQFSSLLVDPISSNSSDNLNRFRFPTEAELVSSFFQTIQPPSPSSYHSSSSSSLSSSSSSSSSQLSNDDLLKYLQRHQTLLDLVTQQQQIRTPPPQTPPLSLRTPSPSSPLLKANDINTSPQRKKRLDRLQHLSSIEESQDEVTRWSHQETDTKGTPKKSKSKLIPHLNLTKAFRQQFFPRSIRGWSQTN